MGKTEISLQGSGVARFLRWKNIPQRPEQRSFQIGEFAVGEGLVDTPFGKMDVSHSFVTASNNQEVVIVCPGLRRKGNREARRISVRNDTGAGTQQLSKNVMLVVSTNAERTVFEANTR